MNITTTSLKVVGGLAVMASARGTLTMIKVGGYESTNGGSLEIVAVKPSTDVSYFKSYTWYTIYAAGDVLVFGNYSSEASF